MNSNPKSFFKYFGHPYDQPLENGALKVLAGMALKVTPPNEFNDPFEFTPRVSNSVTKEEAQKYLRTAIIGKQSVDGLPDRFKSDLADVVLGLAKNQNELNYRVQQSVSQIISQDFGVICFSENPDHPVMWAHYAANHSGLMLEFDSSAPLFQSVSFFPVEYKNQKAIFKTNTESDFSVVKELAKRKSPAWEYEQEYRLIVPLKETNVLQIGAKRLHLLKIDAAWIKSVTLGHRASVEIHNQVAILRRQNPHLELHRMIMDDQSFALCRQVVHPKKQK